MKIKGLKVVLCNLSHENMSSYNEDELEELGDDIDESDLDEEEDDEPESEDDDYGDGNDNY